MCLFCCAGCPSGTCEAEGGSGLETCSGALEAPSLHYWSDSCLCVWVCVSATLWRGLPFLHTRINVSTQRLHSGGDRKKCMYVCMCVCVRSCVCVSRTAHGAAVVRNWQETKTEAL